EIVGHDDGTERTPAVTLLNEYDARDIETQYVAEHRVLLANIEISGIRKAEKFLRMLLVLRKELHHFMRLGISRRDKEKPVYQDEYGGIHANAQREHGYR